MKSHFGLALAWVGAAAVVLGTTPTAGAVAPGSAPATIVIHFETPEGVPGLARLADPGGDAYATKVADGTTGTVALPVLNGTHALRVRPVMVGSLRYIGVATKPSIQVGPGGTSTVTVAYHLSEGVQDVHATGVTDTSIDLAWKIGTGHVRVRRTVGDVPAATPSRGTAVPVSGKGLNDTGLTPGTRYNYSFWTDPGDSAHGVDQATGPFVLSVGTADPSTAAVASYVAGPDTFFPQGSDIVSVQPTTAGGARVVLAAGSSRLFPAPRRCCRSRRPCAAAC